MQKNDNHVYDKSVFILYLLGVEGVMVLKVCQRPRVWIILYPKETFSLLVPLHRSLEVRAEKLDVFAQGHLNQLQIC